MSFNDPIDFSRSDESKLHSIVRENFGESDEKADNFRGIREEVEKAQGS
jgi:hypothetical protein